MVAPVSAALPIDEHLSAIARAVAQHGGAIVVAEPGAGKTTRVPPMLLDATGLDIVCTQPRRIAARLSAARVAEERGCALGQEVGYELRFERQRTERTKLCFMTEGLALRQWQRVAGRERLLILDEFHERSLDADMLLALAAQERRAGGKLALVVMSATLDAQPLATFLKLPIIRSEGRNFPVESRSVLARDGEYVEQHIGRAVREAIADQKHLGNILIFLPGMGEIRRCQTHLQDLAAARDLLLLPLHGGLTREEQDRALRPSRQRRIILATNVAETSLTIEGVTTVIDAGTARIARHSPWTGLASLQVEPISQASAKQRAGRAGRTAPGLCIRTYSEHDLRGRRAFDTPEISRADLSSCALQLLATGTDIASLTWLAPPPTLATEQALELLGRLEAVEDGSLTKLGLRMSTLPLHPRLARLVIEAQRLGVLELGARAAGLLSESGLRRHRGHRDQSIASSQSDVLDELDLLAELENGGFRMSLARAMGVDLTVAKNVIRSSKQILRSIGGNGSSSSLTEADRDEALQRTLLAAFPDRAGRRVRPRSESILLCRGGAVTMSPASAVLDPEYLLAIDVEARGVKAQRSVLVRVASAIDPSWLLDLDGVREVDEHIYQPNEQRVVRRTGIFYGDIAIDEELIVDPKRMDSQAATLALRGALLNGKLQDLVDVTEIEDYRKRHAFVARHAPDLDWPIIDAECLVDALLAGANAPTRLSELKQAKLLDALHWSLTQEQRQALDRLAPTHIALPGRARVPVHYESDREPWIESRLQDFFGVKDSPSVASGRVPLVLHLLAPNYRAVQVTTDLPGFWDRHYPGLRTQLMRRYPRHKWPEKP